MATGNVPSQGRLAQLMGQIRSANSSGSWMKQAASMIVEQMLNAEVDDRLGPGPSQRLRDMYLAEPLDFNEILSTLSQLEQRINKADL
jgi:hypothetical protein